MPMSKFIICIIFLIRILNAQDSIKTELKELKRLIIWDERLKLELSIINSERNNRDSIRLETIVRNTSNKDVKIYFQEHHNFHGKLPYPRSFSLSVYDNNKNNIISGWQSYNYWSTRWPSREDDYITLNAYSEIKRSFSLRDIIADRMNGKFGIYFLKINNSNLVRINLKP